MGKLTGISFVILTLAISFNWTSAYLTTTPKSSQSPPPEITEPVCKDLDYSCLAKVDVSKFKNALDTTRTSIENLSINVNEDSKQSLLQKLERAQEIFGNFKKSFYETPEFACLRTNTCWDTVTKIFQDAIAELKEATENEGEAKITTFAKPPWKKWRRKIGKALKKVKIVISVGNQGWKVRPGL